MEQILEICPSVGISKQNDIKAMGMHWSHVPIIGVFVFGSNLLKACKMKPSSERDWKMSDWPLIRESVQAVIPMSAA